MATFPNPEWIEALKEKLNIDERYAQIARNWEGDMIFEIEPGGALAEKVVYYIDLWHGKCRDAYPLPADQPATATFTLRAPFDNYARLVKGEIDPMQALLTRKITVHGNMAVLMRNVPTVLDFVRCCREVTDDVLAAN
jgi:putative sterol carrier protein